MITLYPLKFKPIYKEKIWGGNRLATLLHKQPQPPALCGESWEISGVQDNVSEVSNGFLEGNTIEELMEVYMGDLVGEKVYEKFGVEFPLLIKLIDANDILSVQVHPDDALARKKHHAYGKTEMWYILDAEPGSELIAGFKKPVSSPDFSRHFEQKTFLPLLQVEKVEKGDAFFIPAGTIHAINKGILLAEIQQTSDVTYRLYDWDRTDSNGKPRELHVDLALEAIHYDTAFRSKIEIGKTIRNKSKLAQCPYFVSNLIEFEKPYDFDYSAIDSFVIYMCMEGECRIFYHPDQEAVSCKAGETVLIPAELKEILIEPVKKTKLIEIYIP